MLRYISTASFILLLFSLSCCSDTEDTRPCANRFFTKLTQNKITETGRMVDAKSRIYPIRNSFLKRLHQNDSLGKLISIGGRGISASAETTYSTFGFTRVDLTTDLNYDSASVKADVTLVDRGNGFKIYQVELLKQK